MTLRVGALPGYVHVLLAAAVIFAAGVLNSRPAIFPDTAHYFSQGEWLASALGLISEARPAWRDADVTSLMPGSPAMADKLPLTIAGARSPTYGLLLFMSHAVGGLRLLSAVQALLAAWVLYAMAKAFAPQWSAGRFWLVTAAAVGGTSLTFFANFAMPDLFSGFALAAAAVLLLAPDRLSRWEQVGLWVLLALALSCHKTNLVTFAGVLAVAAVLMRGLRLPDGVAARRVASTAAAGLAAIAIGWSASTWYRAETGLAQSSPPFLTARIMADGAGRPFLAKACAAGADYVLCRFQEAAYLNEDGFLWSNRRRVGVFSVADYETRLRLKAEEMRFVSAVVREAPVQTVRTALAHWAAQLNSYYVNDPLRPPGWFLDSKWRGNSPFSLLPDAEACRAAPDSCVPRVSVLPLARWHQLTLLLSILGTAWALSRVELRALFRPDADEADRERRTLLLAAVLLSAGVIINAAVCGALSGVFPRYQSRVIWLVPTIAMLLALSFGRGWARSPIQTQAAPA